MEFEFDGTVSKNLKLSKPIEEYDIEVLRELERQGLLILTRKEDGWKGLAPVDESREICFLTDGIKPIMPIKLAHIKAELSGISESLLPPRSLLVGEIVANGETDDRGRVGSLLGSKNEDEIAEMLRTGPLPHYRLFNIAFLGGKSPDMTYEEIYNLIVKMTEGLKYVKPVELLTCSIDEVVELSKQRGIEGAVAYDKRFKFVTRNDGIKNPNRPYGCWKVKPATDIDVVLLGARMRPDDPKTVRDVKVCQIDPNNGRWIRVYHFGSFTAKMRQELSQMPMRMTNNNRGEYKVVGWFVDPPVARLTVTARKVKTGKVESPKQFELRYDKPADECFAPDSYPEAEYVDIPSFDE